MFGPVPIDNRRRAFLIIWPLGPLRAHAVMSARVVRPKLSDPDLRGRSMTRRSTELDGRSTRRCHRSSSARCRPRAPPISRPARCSTASAPSTACPRRRPGRPCAARWCTRCWSSCSTCPPPSARSSRGARAAARGLAARAAADEPDSRRRCSPDRRRRRRRARRLAGVGGAAARQLLRAGGSVAARAGRPRAAGRGRLDGLRLRGYIDRLDVTPPATSGSSTTRPARRRARRSRPRRCSR